MIGHPLRFRQTRLILLTFAIPGLPLLHAPPGLAAEPVAKLLAKDVAYANRPPEKSPPGQTLDLHGSAEKPETPRPVVVYVHGGGWRQGDKAMVGEKPRAFVNRGYLFASVNYRLEGSVSPREQAGDVARAVHWLHEHADEYGGDPGKIFLIGHSAGAHLAALVATDERLLGAYGLEPGVLKGVVLLDGAGYDVPRQMAHAKLPPLRELYRNAFGDDPEAQREASPAEHVAAGKAYPPFLLFHVGLRADSRAQAELLAGKLREAGGQARTSHERDKNHLTINRELGLPDDETTEKVFAFLAGALEGG